jgi:hypothetical protein
MCDFCGVYETIKELNEEYKIDECIKKYKSTIIEIWYKNGLPKSRTQHRDFKLNFCPECGKKLNQ